MCGFVFKRANGQHYSQNCLFVCLHYHSPSHYVILKILDLTHLSKKIRKHLFVFNMHILVKLSDFKDKFIDLAYGRREKL